jgi:hypothetical protein
MIEISRMRVVLFQGEEGRGEDDITYNEILIC